MKLFILTKVYWTDHVHKLDPMLNKFKEIGLKYKIEKSFFGQTITEYLWFWVTHNGVKPINIKTTFFSKISTMVYWCSELIAQYVSKAVTYVSAFN